MSLLHFVPVALPIVHQAFSSCIAGHLPDSTRRDGWAGAVPELAAVTAAIARSHAVAGMMLITGELARWFTRR